MKVKQKWNEELVKEYCAELGYQVAGDLDYKTSSQKISLICPKGHQVDIRWSYFYARGHRCKHCSSRMQWDTDSVKAYVKAFGYTLDPSYQHKSTARKMPLTCSKGHPMSVTLNAFSSGRVRCGACYYGRFADAVKNQSNGFALWRIIRRIERALHKTIDAKTGASILANTLHPQTIKMYSTTNTGKHIDHIIPVSWFNLNDLDQVYWCFHPANLRWLIPQENNKRKDNLTILEIQKFSDLQKHILNIAQKRSAALAKPSVID